MGASTFLSTAKSALKLDFFLFLPSVGTPNEERDEGRASLPPCGSLLGDASEASIKHLLPLGHFQKPAGCWLLKEAIINSSAFVFSYVDRNVDAPIKTLLLGAGIHKKSRLLAGF